MKSVDEIYQELLAAFARRAGFTPEGSCDLAVRLYAAAAQIQALDIQAEWVLDQSFPQTAQGVYLDRHAAMRGLSRLPASRAVGTLRFSVDSPPALPVNIPAGTVCMTADERRFQSTDGVTLEAGETYVDAPAEALEAGGGGNAVAGAVRFLTACPVAVTACTNPAAFSGGSDAEDDETLRRRVLESYQRLPNGANEGKARAELAISTLFTGRMLGRPVLLAELGSRLYALEGVENYRFSAPAADLAADNTVLPVLGTLTVTELEA